MNTDATMDRLSETMDGIDARRLVSCLDDYIRMSSGTRLSKKKKKNGFDKIPDEMSEILSRSALMLNYMMKLNFGSNGKHSGPHEQKTLFYLKEIRKQQMGLLMEISDEIEIMGNVIDQSGKIREIMGRNSCTLEKAEYLTDVLHERIVKRPTAGFRVNGDDEKIRELNKTFRNMKEYEDSYEEIFEKNLEDNCTKNAFVTLQHLISESCGEIEQRKKKIVAGIKELKKGWKLLKKLATRGYSWRFRRSLNIMVDKHNKRIVVFRELVEKNRDTGFLN